MRILFAISLLFILFSCNKEKHQIVIEDDLPAFDSVLINSSFNVHLVEDSVYSIRVEGDDRYLENLHYEVTNNTLEIKIESGTKFLTPTRNQVDLYIHSKPLSLVVANSTCDVRTDNPITSDEFGLVLKSKANQATLDLDCKTFYYWNNYPCGGKLTLSGQAEEVKIWNWAIMTVDAAALKTKYALVENGARNSCAITVTEKLDYKITGEGDIFLYGSPAIIQNNGVEGTGHLIQQ